MEIGLAAMPQELKISDREFALFRELIAAQTGIALNEHKRHLLRTRLGKRLRLLGLRSFAAYYDYLTQYDPSGQEMVHFINALTTNKTDFFREPHHFHYLQEQWAPIRRDLASHTGDRVVRFWSAGCSSGEEAYTLAMVLSEALQPPGRWNVKILASDLDTDILAQAETGIFPIERTQAIPSPLLKRYFLCGVRTRSGFVKVRRSLREMIVFRRINFNDAVWPIRTQFDGIFCRNVLIYFNRDTQRHILGRLLTFLKPDGMLFLGHSESIFGLVEGLQHLGNTIYARVNG